MEVFVRNLPDQTTEKQAQKYFRPILAELSINTFHCQKPKGKSFAKLTLPHRWQGARFLQQHGQTKPGREGFNLVQKKLFHMDRPVNCSESNNIPDPFLLQSLCKEENDRKLVKDAHRHETKHTRAQRPRKVFSISGVDCGSMDYVNHKLGFMTHFQQHRAGILIFGHRCVIVNLEPLDRASPTNQIEISYQSIESLIIGNSQRPFVTFSLYEPPKIFEKQDSPEDITATFQELFPQSPIGKPRLSPRLRVMSLGRGHETVVGMCLCYRIRVESDDIYAFRTLKRLPGHPDTIQWDVPDFDGSPLLTQMTCLHNDMLWNNYSEFTFEAKFQFQRLAQNCYLPPYKVNDLMRLVRLSSAYASPLLAASIRRLSSQIPFAGVDAEAFDLSVKSIHQTLQRNQQSVIHEQEYTKDIAAEYGHITNIHKAMVTPTGIYLDGPVPEVKNRVLRKYAAYSDYFLQVSFLDENGEPLMYDRLTSLSSIYHNRFKKILEGAIRIAGRGYEFLGFSHSSLRAQTCWFMAPFVLDGELCYARRVIKDLGDFSLIRSPAKCAARIGQAFSQTFSSVRLSSNTFRIMPDIERNGRTFSDGVGTCSREVLSKIWDAYAQSRAYKPTVYQIRYAGAKGMISLDNRLRGEALCLRPSMIKFEAPGATDIEICGAGFKQLPMYLNRQLIKILEDLGVKDSSFLELQAEAVEQLRMTTVNPINAANFLARNVIGKSARLPWLIRNLSYIQMSFDDDHFLRSTLELAVLIQLKQLKYRARIPVENGMTVYGIMDETGHLEEGQIYCSVQNEKSGSVLTGKVVITRCPALHPGDVQCVEAVDVPQDSPLRAVHNCVVFSSKGARDLPSQLSGGDLDGDLYNIIYDDNLYPTLTYEPADYKIAPPVDIKREVTRSDMTDFFIQFMENDQLGRICTLHQTLADQKSSGTLDPECILLAELASTAVDFSKTGIPADLSRMPKHSSVRPDFQAPGPRLLIESSIGLEDIEALKDPDEDEEDEVNTAETAYTQLRYYSSEKVLGKLYRAIDEHEFFEGIQRRSRQKNEHVDDLASRVLQYVLSKTALIQYKHHMGFARDIREAYEDNLTDTMLQFSSHPSHFVSEVEVFCGSIIGKNGSQSNRQREFSTSMKEKHDRDVAYTVQCILRGEQGDGGKEEALERSIACLDLACQTHNVDLRRKMGKLVSFTWVAAAVCLGEVEKFVEL